MSLSKGIVLKDAAGSVLVEPEPMERDPSRQLTIHEYAAMKNSEDGLKSLRMQGQLN